MSNKNETSESKKESLLSKIKSKYILKDILDCLITKRAADIFKYNKGVLQNNLSGNSRFKNNTLLPFIEQRRIESLKNVSKWTPYLRYIYSVLYEISCDQYKEVYGKNQLDDEKKIIKRYAHPSYNAYASNFAFEQPRKKYIIDTKLFVIEAIEYLLLFEVIYWTQEKNLFNETNLKIEKDLTVDKLKNINVDKLITKILNGIYRQKYQESENKGNDSVSRLCSDIYNSSDINDFLRKTCRKSLAYNENGYIYLNDELYETVYSGFKDQIDCIINKIPKDKNGQKEIFLQNIFFTALGFSCLNNNKLYGNAYYSVCNKILLDVMIKEFGINYKVLVNAFLNNLRDNGYICPFIYGDGDYNTDTLDKQEYPVYNYLKSGIEDAKEKYKHYVASKKEEPKQEETKQKNDKSKREIF